MKIEEIQEYITQNVQKLEELKVSNMKIMMAVKDNRKINNEIEYIKNQVFIELEKGKETINQTQATLVATEEILKQIITKEYINIKDAFKEKNREQEQQNEMAREYLSKQLEQIKHKKEQKKSSELEMEVEENNNVRISQTITSFKPIIQDSQFNNAFIGQQINQNRKENKNKEQIITSEEDRVNKQNTYSSEENKIQIENMSPQQALEMLQKEATKNRQPIDWSKHKVDTSCLVAQEDPELLTESLLIIEKQRIADQIAFVKINNKMIFKEYLTEFGVDLNKQAKEIPTGAYLIMLLDGNHINELKIRFTQATDLNRLNRQIVAYAESISVHAFSTIAYKIEAERIKLEGSKQELTKTITEILLSKHEHIQEEIKQIRIQVLEQQYNINIIIHVTTQMKQSRKNLEKHQKKDEEKSKI